MITLSKYEEDLQITPNFNTSEFRCTCGCETLILNVDLVIALQELRLDVGMPLKINSGYRCPAKNKRTLGAAKNSQHMKGNAADVLSHPTGLSELTLGRLAAAVFLSSGVNTDVMHGGELYDSKSYPFKRIGVYDGSNKKLGYKKGFVHLGVNGWVLRKWGWS